MTSLLQAAMFYSDFGWAVFPCHPRGKTPLTSHGVRDASRDQEQIRAWWEKWPNANIAVACGAPSVVYVLDIDMDVERGVDGYVSMKEFPRLSETVCQNTPRGGCHVFFRTDNPPANKNSFRPGIDIRGDGYYVILSPSIHPNGGQYLWERGCGPGELPIAEFPEFLRPTVRPALPAEITSLVAPAPLQPPEGFASDDVLRRASAYLATCDPAVQGHNGHARLLWAAVALIHGFRLSDAEAWELLAREYNPRCVPPWDLGSPKDHKDFSRKVTEARKLTPEKPPGWLLADDFYLPTVPASVEIGRKAAEALLARRSAVQVVEKPTLILPQLLPGGSITKPSLFTWTTEDMRFLTEPTGLVGRICSWINSTAAQPQPLLTLSCVLSFCGALFGRKIRTADGVRTNIYCMGIAESCAGKNHAAVQIRRLCEAAECVDLLGGTDWASDSALEKRMSISPTTLFLCDEIGHILMNIKSGRNQFTSKLVPMLMNLYSSSGSTYLGREYAEDGKQRTIAQPCCCIYGTSTPDRFLAGLSPDELQDGWLSRCLVFRSTTTPRRLRDKIEEPVPGDIVEIVKAWHLRSPMVLNAAAGLSANLKGQANLLPDQLVIPYGDGVDSVFLALDDEAWKFGESHSNLANLWKRAEENAKKLALKVAAGDNFDSPVITVQNAYWACRLIRYLLYSFSCEARKITAGRVDGEKQKIVDVIESGGQVGLLKHELTRLTRWLNGRERDALLIDLCEAGEIVAQRVETHSHGARYWTAENYVKYLEQQK
jgi:hypothetical protein